MKKVISIWIVALMMGGCTGFITGHQYKKEDLVTVYKVVKLGVSKYMTIEQIQELNLDKGDTIVTDVYKIVKGNDVE